MRGMGAALLAVGVLVGGLGTLVVIGIHGVCENNCDRLVPVWPFVLVLLVCGLAVIRPRGRS